jgi:hypothetical protein
LIFMQPSIIAFLGPSLAKREAASIFNADYRGPAAMGDVTRAAFENPAAIVLIDGIFESGPSVWHKEILWALSKGIAVIGASSMGALRAAELCNSGMVGFGQVFEDFRSGRLDDDDEVAVIHAPAELDYAPLSDAMVDIRAAVEAAVSRGVLDISEARKVLQTAKACHFKHRHLSEAVSAGITPASGEGKARSASGWLGRSQYSVKADDARRLLLNLNELVELGRTRARQARPFVETVYLHRLAPFGFSGDPQVITSN